MKPHIRIEERTKTVVSDLTPQWIKARKQICSMELGPKGARGGCLWLASPGATLDMVVASRDGSCSLEVAGVGGGFITFYSGPLSL